MRRDQTKTGTYSNQVDSRRLGRIEEWLEVKNALCGKVAGFNAVSVHWALVEGLDFLEDIQPERWDGESATDIIQLIGFGQTGWTETDRNESNEFIPERMKLPAEDHHPFAVDQ